MMYISITYITKSSLGGILPNLLPKVVGLCLKYCDDHGRRRHVGHHGNLIYSMACLLNICKYIFNEPEEL